MIISGNYHASSWSSQEAMRKSAERAHDACLTWHCCRCLHRLHRQQTLQPTAVTSASRPYPAAVRNFKYHLSCTMYYCIIFGGIHSRLQDKVTLLMKRYTLLMTLCSEDRMYWASSRRIPSVLSSTVVTVRTVYAAGYGRVRASCCRRYSRCRHRQLCLATFATNQVRSFHALPHRFL